MIQGITRVAARQDDTATYRAAAALGADGEDEDDADDDDGRHGLL